MGLRDKLFNRAERQPVEIPAYLQPDDPVNYDTVLDWLLGLSNQDYDTMINVVQIYREANASAAKALGVEDKPTTELRRSLPTDSEIEEGLDALIATEPKELRKAMAKDAPAKAKKKQSPSKEKKITVNDK